MSGSFYFRKFGKKIFFIVFAILIIFGSIWTADRAFQIRQISVIGSGVSLVVDQTKLTKSLLFFPSDLVKKQILADNPVIADIEIRKKYPHTLEIVPVVREKTARLYSSSQHLVIDKEGVVLALDSGQMDQLAVLKMDIPVVHIGDRIKDPSVVSGLLFIREVKNLLPIQYIEKFDSTSLLAHSEKTDILFPQQSQARLLATTLQTLLPGFRIKGTLPTRIDLRFEKPIVTF